MKLIASITLAGILLMSSTGAQAQSFNWASAYQSAQPGQMITVPSGNYGSVILSYRADLANRCSILDPSSLVTFDVPDAVTINGEFEIFGSCVRIKGRSLGGGFYSLTVKGQIHTITQSQTQHPDNVIVESVDTVTASVFSADSVLYRDMDIGPATVVQTGGTVQAPRCAILEGPGDENKIAARGFFVPRNITYDGVRIHHQLGRNPERGSCHFGGLFIINADGLTIRNSVFERNVVYHVQIQNFSGPAPSNVRFENNSFGCPVEWLDSGDVCDGQRAIQLNTSSGGVTAALIGNASANGVNGLFGCYTPCDRSGVSEAGTIVSPENPNPPPLPGSPPPPPPPPPDPDRVIFCSEFVPEVVAVPYYGKWATQNPGEKARWEPFRDGLCLGLNPVTPTMATKFGRALVAAGKEAL